MVDIGLFSQMGRKGNGFHRNEGGSPRDRRARRDFTYAVAERYTKP